MAIVKDYFGFLPQPLRVDSRRYSIRPVSSFAQAMALIEDEKHEDGFLYPSMSWMTREGKRLPNTTRPQHLARPIVTHEVDVRSRRSKYDLRHDLSGFLANFAAVLFDARVQFNDWWIDLRIPVSAKHKPYIQNDVAGDCIDRCCREWKSWKPRLRKQFLDVMVMFQRAPCYEWDWEQLNTEYMVFDGCFRIADELHQLSRKYSASNKKNLSHAKRLQAMCRAFGIRSNARLFKTITRLRNDLIHESQWDGGRPGTVRSGKAFMLPRHMHRMNRRLMIAMLGYRNKYVGTPWWVLGQFLFDAVK